MIRASAFALGLTLTAGAVFADQLPTSKAGNGPWMLDKSARASDVESQRDTETGWIIIGGVFAAAIFVPGYAVLKRFGERTFDNNSSYKEQNKDGRKI